MTYLLLLLTVLCIAAGQVLQKVASARLAGAPTIGAAARALADSVAFRLSVVLMAAGLVTWLATLTAMEISSAYPVLSLSFVITALLSRLLLQERVTVLRWAGILFVSAGATLMLATS
ncbi:MAG TPA: EamA family transporter [Woeseiaceae bacterium]|nr:EamA family transporter [Woeseiaceae bacterium]